MEFDFFRDGLVLFDEYQLTSLNKIETINGIYNLNVKVKDKVYQEKFAVIINIKNTKTFIPEVYLPNISIPYGFEHIYKNKNNLCCLGLNYEIELSWGTKRTFYDFLTKILDPFLVNYLEYCKTKSYINGDRSHAKEGLIEYYSQFFPNVKYNNIFSFLSYCYIKALRKEPAKGNNLCPCNSGNRIRNCIHQEIIRQFINNLLSNKNLKEAFIKDMTNYIGEKK